MTKTRKKKDVVTQAGKYVKINNLNAARQQRYRDNLSEEQLIEYRRKARERYQKRKAEKKQKSINELSAKEQNERRKRWKMDSKKYRDKKKAVQQAISNTPPNSDNSDEEQRELSRQATAGRRKVRKDRAKAYREIKRQEKVIKQLERKVSKYKKRLQRQKQKASPTPRKQVRNIIGRQKVSEEVRKKLFVGCVLESQIKNRLSTLSPRSKESHIVRNCIGTKIVKKYRIQNELKRILPYKFNKHIGNDVNVNYKKRCYRTVGVTETKKLQRFFEDDTVSKMCPGKKDTVKRGYAKKQRRILLETIQNLHKRFLKENPDVTLSLNTFRRAKPFCVDFPKAKDRETCACIVHTNMELIMSALKNAQVLKFGNPNDLVESVTCSTNDESCMFNTFEKCKDNIVEYNTNTELDEEIKYFKWCQVVETKMIKGQEKQIKKTVKLQKTCTPSSMKEEFLTSFNGFKKHVYNAKHQAKEYKKVKKNLKEGELVFQVDFSQNYVAKYEKEIQATHFGASKKQISLHTGLLYYYSEQKKKVGLKTFCTVSDNLDHNAYAVWGHMKPILEECCQSYPQTHTIHIFSDSPSSQYRNRANIHFMREMLPKIFKNLEHFTWNFSEPGHGKGAMDGVGGSIKRCADLEVKHGNDVTSASDLVKFLSPKSNTFIIEIPAATIEEAKKSLPDDIPPMKGIMSIRQIACDQRSIDGRRLSCFECLPNDESTIMCHHYSLSKTERESKSKTHQRKKKILKVSEVYSESSETDDGEDIKPRMDFTTEELKPGQFVAVRVASSLRKNSSKTFLAVIVTEADSENELNVMFMKEYGKNKTLFFPDEDDTSYIDVDDVIGFYPNPTIVKKGKRVFHRFNKPLRF